MKIPRKLKKEFVKIDRWEIKREMEIISRRDMIVRRKEKLLLRDNVKINKWTKRLIAFLYMSRRQSLKDASRYAKESAERIKFQNNIN